MSFPLTGLLRLSRQQVLLLILLLAAVFYAYSPIFSADYQNWDDPGHSFDHPQVVSERASIRDIFLKEDTVNRTYIPLTIASFVLEKKLFGLASFCSHRVNIFLHVCVVFLIFFFARLMGLSFAAAYFGCGIFALHPMHVESVAWITERKDVLYSSFYLSTLVLYVRFLEERRGVLYISALLMAILSLLSKPMALSLPFVLIIIDFQRQRKFDRQLFLEKIPFLVVGVLIAGITYVLNARQTLWSFPDSFLIWIWSAVFYIRSFFLPFGLFSFYDCPVPVSMGNFEYALALVVFFLIIVGLFIGRRFPWILFAAGVYFTSIFFLLRFDRFDSSIVADRFMYLPSMGICLLIGYWGDVCIRRNLQHRILWVVFYSLVLLCLVGGAYFQVSYWRNSWTLWTRVLEFRPGLYYAHYMRANALHEGRFYKGVAIDFENFVFSRLFSQPVMLKDHILVRTKMKYFRALYCLRWYHSELSGNIWNNERFQRIPVEYTYLSYGGALSLIGDHAKALIYYQKALNRGMVSHAEMFALAKSYCSLGQYEKSIEFYTRVIEQSPLHYEALLARGALRAHLGQMGAALDDIQYLLRINDKLPGAYDLAFNVFIGLGKKEEADQVIAREKVLFPLDPQVLWHQGILAETQGDHACAERFFIKARQNGYSPN